MMTTGPLSSEFAARASRLSGDRDEARAGIGAVAIPHARPRGSPDRPGENRIAGLPHPPSEAPLHVLGDLRMGRIVRQVAGLVGIERQVVQLLAIARPPPPDL